MADPFTLAILAATATAASAYQGAQVAKAQGKADKKIAEYNAQLAERQGKARLEAAQIESSRLSRQQSIFEASNRARSAKSGISLSESPSAIEVLADTAYQFHLDRNLLLNQGMQDYIQGVNQASLLRAEGAFAKEQGKAQALGGYLSAAGGAISMFGMSSSISKPPSGTGNSSLTRARGPARMGY